MYATQDEPFQTSSLGNAPNNRISLQKKRQLVYFLTRGTNYPRGQLIEERLLFVPHI